jgi:hypothetical protein
MNTTDTDWLRVFEIRVLRRIIGPKREKVTGDWRRLHNEELYALYFTPNIIRVMKSTRLKWAGHVARVEESRGAYRVLMGKPEGRRPLGRPRYRWEDNIKTDLKLVGCTWTGLFRLGIRQVAGCCECGNEPSGAIKCGGFLD